MYYEVGIDSEPPGRPGHAHLSSHRGFRFERISTARFIAVLARSNEAFGFVSSGVNVAYELAFIPKSYGTWTATAGYTYYYLGEGAGDFNTRNQSAAEPSAAAAGIGMSTCSPRV